MSAQKWKGSEPRRKVPGKVPQDGVSVKCEGGFPKYQSERISLCPVALHTRGGEPVEFVFAAPESDRSARCQTSATLKSFINRKAREIMPGSNALSCTECTENRS